jgi:hypothetical protein
MAESSTKLIVGGIAALVVTGVVGWLYWKGNREEIEPEVMTIIEDEV